MLSKFLLTLLVLITAFFFLRQRHLADSSNRQARTTSPATVPDQASTEKLAKSEFASDLRFAAYMTVILIVGLGATLYYFRWQEDHEVLTVTLHRDNAAEPISYQVFRYQLQDRSFVTIDGTTVTVASSERMEILGLD